MPGAHHLRSPEPCPISQSYNTGSKEFEIVDMTDKKACARVRNTLNSRKYRQSKVDRIRELELQLRKSKAERELWKTRAKSLGWNE